MEAYMKVQPKKIKLSDYDIQQTLGMGAYATVKLAKNKSSGKFCTVKIFKKEEIIRLKQTEHIHNELKILSFLDHSFIVKTDGFAQDERYLYIVMELVNGGELFTELRKAMKFKIEQAT